MLPKTEEEAKKRFVDALTGFLRLSAMIAAAGILIQSNKAPASRIHSPAPREAAYIMPQKTFKTRAPIVKAGFVSSLRYSPAKVYPAHSGVQTGCFRRPLWQLLGVIQHHYRQPVVITSGYRGVAHNARAGGVRGSTHTYCAAADIKINGVNKYSLANFVRALPQRGGVGIYCHNAVHVDTGTPRDWNWCGTKTRKKRR